MTIARAAMSLSYPARFMLAAAMNPILKIARTVADLDQAPALEPKHVSEAIQYRSLDRRGVA